MFRFVETGLIVITVAFMAFAGYISYRSRNSYKDTDEVVVEPPPPAVLDAIAPRIQMLETEGGQLILYRLLPHQWDRLRRWFVIFSDEPEKMLYRIRPKGQDYDDIYLKLDSLKAFQALDAARGALRPEKFIAPPIR